MILIKLKISYDDLIRSNNTESFFQESDNNWYKVFETAIFSRIRVKTYKIMHD